ncbi:MAG: translation initiation factor IF-2 [Gemmatimonadales bacterium]
MVKTKVQDLAGELEIPAEALMKLLRDMNVAARGPQSSLDDDQVAQVRVRWEREKRKKRAAAPAAPKRRVTKKAQAAEPEPAVTAKPTKRRRTAAEMAEATAQLEAERQAEAAAAAAAFDLERPILEKPEPVEAPGTPMLTIEERARALFKDLPPLPVEAEGPAAPPGATPGSQPPPPPATGPVVHRAPFIPPRVQRPMPGTESGRAPRGPRPVFSSSPGGAAGAVTGPPTQRPGRPDGRFAGAGAPTRTFGPDAKPQVGDGRRKGKKGRKSYVDQEAVQANILKTLAGMKGGIRKRRSDEPSYRDLIASRTAEEQEKEKTRIRVNEFISVAELAEIMKVPATQIVQFAFKELGLMVTVNQRLDFDQIELIASEFGFQAVREDEYAAAISAPVAEKEGDLQPRPPVVTIMGHVDHGKTSLLDHIRKTNVVAGEAGGITQHIGAYLVSLPAGQALTFLDTPGHEAFTAMRARGAQVTDIVILVIAADDQVMPQTVEAISHARNAGVPIVVAINKIDLPTANIAKVKQDLLQHNVVLEEFGGTVLSAQISAKKGTGIDELLEKVLLQAEILDLKANPSGAAHGTVLEATLDPGKGPLATILVQRGTLHQGDSFICGKYSGRVRALSDERGKPVKEAGPSIPVQVLGFEGVPAAGDTFLVVADANEAREIAQKRQRLEREAQNRRTGRAATLEDFSRALQEGQVSQLKIIIKADQGGPAEALADALAQLSTSEVRVEVVHRGVGAITESDVLLAKAAGAIVLGFHVRPDANARSTAEREGVDVRTYRIIYEAVEDVRAALEGLLKPEEREQVLGEAEVLQLFKVSKVGTVAGCVVRSGTIQRTAKVRVVRDGTLVYTGNLASLKRFKDDVKEVKEGLECGIGIENFNDLKVGDRIEAFRIEEVKRTLQPASGVAG